MNKSWLVLGAAVLFLVWGIGIGAGLMYMFDPDRGKRRRRLVRNRAEDLLDKTNDTVDNLRDSAGDLRDRTVSRIPMTASMLKRAG